MKRCLSLLVALLMLCCIPASGMAAKMEKGVPVWTEETVQQYLTDYIEGKSVDRLWGYYDLQIRRYLSEESFRSFLVDLEFLTGDFLAFGSYRTFEEEKPSLKVHVQHLCMEKMDLDVYFTHKNEKDDWEVMALEFVPSQEEELPASYQEQAKWTESIVAVGAEPYLLEGVLTLPASSSADHPVPACVLVHDFGAHDHDLTIGQTKLFEDIAAQFAENGIATIRYDKRTFAYPEAVIESVGDEVIQDALSAAALLKSNACIDSSRIVVAGVGLGGMLAPRIVSESDGLCSAVIVIGSTTDRLINVVYQREKDSVAVLPEEEAKVIKNAVRNIGKMKEEAARELTLFGKNGYYFWDFEQFDAVKTIRKMRMPIFVAHGTMDAEVKLADGYEAYREDLGKDARFAEYRSYRRLNHLLMSDVSTNAQGKPEYQDALHLDALAGLDMATWILNLKTK